MLLVALAMICGSVGGHRSSTISAVAASGNLQDPTQGTTARQKWEYCAIADVDIYGASDRSVGVAVIYYFKSTGYQAERVEVAAERSVDGARTAVDMARAKAIAKLGEDGWEMLCEGMPFATRLRPAERDKALYFRRAR